MKNTLFILFYFILIILWTGCDNGNRLKIPPEVKPVLDAFYLENHNERVLCLCDSIFKTKPNAEILFFCKLYKSAALCEKGNIDQAIQLMNTVKPPEKNVEKFWYNTIKGLLLFRQQKLLEAYQVLLQTVNGYKPADLRALALSERLLSRISFSYEYYDKGLEWLAASCRDYQQNGCLKSVGINYKFLGSHFLDSHNYTEALALLKHAEKTLLGQKDEEELYYVYVNLLDYNLQTHNLPQARFYLAQIKTQIHIQFNNEMKSLLYNNEGTIDIIDKRYDAAIVLFNKTLNLPPHYSTVNKRRISADLHLSKIYLIQNNKDASFAYIQKAKILMNKQSDHSTKYDVYLQAAKNYKLTNNTPLAYANLDSARMELIEVNATISKMSKSFFEARNSIVLLSKHLQQAKESEFKNRTLFLSFLCILLLMLIFSLIVYRLLRSKNLALKNLVEKNLQIVENAQEIINKRNCKPEAKNNKPKYHENEKLEPLFCNLNKWLTTDNRFCRNDLTLDLIAKELNTNRDYLSKAINENNIRFNDLLNKYRIDECIRILSDSNDKRSRYTLSILAKEIGFNSDSVFIEAFKRQTGLTPAQFRRNLDY